MPIAGWAVTVILTVMPTYKRLLIAWLFVPVHRILFRLSRGRLLGRLEGTEVLILVTMSRKSGRRCSSPLLYFQFEDHGDLIVIASNYGQDHHPEWYSNIVADPRVHVEVKEDCFVAEARVTQGRERAELYNKVAETNVRFANYRAYTDREIPVVVLRRTWPMT